MLFPDRIHAGKLLAQKFLSFQGTRDFIVFGIPRGGVVVAKEIASALHAPLDVLICRKIGAPGNEEFAIGAISEQGGLFFNDNMIAAYGISQQYLDGAIASETKKIAEYRKVFRGGRKLPALKKKSSSSQMTAPQPA